MARDKVIVQVAAVSFVDIDVASIVSRLEASFKARNVRYLVSVLLHDPGLITFYGC